MTRSVATSAAGPATEDHPLGGPSADHPGGPAHVAGLHAVLGAAQERLGRPLARFDRSDGGCGARVLVLRRDPRCRVVDDPVVSLDSGHPADTNLRTAVSNAGLDRRDLAVWHLVPWWLEAPDGPDRARAWDEAVQLAGKLWPLLTELRAVVLLGGDAQRAWGRFAHLAPGAEALQAPHPSPLAWHRRAPDGMRNGDLVTRALVQAGDAGR